MSRKQISEKIQAWEMTVNGLYRISGADIIVKNIRTRKEFYLADVTIDNGDHSETYKNCEYRKTLFSLLD